ncbi:hypothetical protein FA13DRAFT_508379 [Coprinellus micaceus]|uniref:Uncharacterized protein n=1 Tax=Coprinellus micaceus TaxID=71717 RepID=A0A4Y7SCG1_COPMI|nr:hypothetical protein FA13DRAFT_508379 [Coprinellus micaceus]
MAETQTQTQGDSDVANHRAEIRPQVPIDDEWIPQILLNEGLRLFFLRAVVASSLVTTGFMLYATVALGRYTQSKPTLKWAIPAVLLTVFTTAHHIGTAFGPLFPLPVWVDICLTVLESICCFAAIGYLTFYSNQLGAQWFPSYGLAALVGFWILSFSVVTLALLKTINYVGARRTSSYQQPVAEGDSKKPAWWKYPAHNLFGRRMWGRNVPGESKWLARLRGLIALIAVCALVAFGLFQTIVTPIAELGKIPHRAYRIAGIDYNTAMGRDVRDVQYSVLLLWSAIRALRRI